MGFKLPTRTLKAEIGPAYLVHVVDPADPTDNPTGSSFKAVLSESYVPLAGTKASFPVKGDIGIDPLLDVSFSQIGAVRSNYLIFSGGNSLVMYTQDVASGDSYGMNYEYTQLLFQRNSLTVGKFDVDENFGIGQTTISAEYQINSVRALSTRGTQNLWVGNSGNTTSTGAQNTCVGLSAGAALTTGAENVMIGQVCGVLITTGSRNTLFGKETAPVLSTGNDNLFAGYRAGYTVTTGSTNTFVGRSAGLNVSTASNGVYVGYGSGLVGTQRTYAGAIGYGATVDQDNSLSLGAAANPWLIGLNNGTPTAWLHLMASTTAAASLRMPSGVAPTTPNNGDIWFDGTDIKMRIGGVTKVFTLV